MKRLTWTFDNNHYKHRDFETLEECFRSAFDFGLYTHPRIVHVHVKDLENDSATSAVNLIDRRELREV